MATTVAFISEKGGVGKTTACYHIAVGLARYHQKRVLVVDADYQRGGISGRFFPDLIEQFASGSVQGTTLYHKFQQLYSDSPRTPDVDLREWEYGNLSIDVVPADPRLSTVSTDKLPSTNNIRQNNIVLHEHMRMVDYVLSPLKGSHGLIERVDGTPIVARDRPARKSPPALRVRSE